MPLNFIFLVLAHTMPDRANPQAYTRTVHSSTPTKEQLLKRAADIMREDQEYLKNFNAAVDKL